MAYAEFPGTNYSELDLHEFIRYYKKVKEEYEGTLREILELKERLDKWEEEGREILTQQVRDVTKLLTDNLNSTVSEIQDEYRSSINTITHQYEVSNQKIEENYNNAVEELKATIDEELRSIRVRYDNLENNFNQKYAELVKQSEDNFRNLEATVSAKIDENYEKLESTLDVKVNEAVNRENTYVNVAFQALLSSVSGTLKEFEKRIKVVEEWTTDYSVEKATTEVYFNFGYNAKEWYDSADITCNDWNNSKITCTEWLVNSKNIFGFYDTLCLDPINGGYSSVEQILYTLIERLKVCAITAEEYDKLKLTATDYDKLHLTAKQYDWGCLNVFRNNC